MSADDEDRQQVTISGTNAQTASGQPVSCPRCHRLMFHVRRKGQVVELCSGCRGQWLDAGELTQMLSVYRELDLSTGEPSDLTCIRCKDKHQLVELKFPQSEVEVDVCADCRGIWLDAGELELLRENVANLVGQEEQSLAERAQEVLGEAQEVITRRQSCPKCRAQLYHLERQGQLFELCSGCQGMWLDSGELTLMIGVYRKLVVGEGTQTGLTCVRCEGELKELKYPGTEVLVDVCPECQGVWLDKGELEALKGSMAALLPPAATSLNERAREILADIDAGAVQRAGCPKCAGGLAEIKLDGHRVERCEECMGTWLETGGLPRLLGVSRRLKPRDGNPTDIACVRCPAARLVELTYPKTEVPIDLCPDCFGVWLDAGEAMRLRSRVRNTAEPA